MESAESPVITPPVPSPDRATKEQLWQQKAAEVGKITDNLGQPIDPEIKDAITATNLLGVNTDGSCEGHLEEGTEAPYIDFGLTDPESELLEERRIKLFDQVFKSPEFAKLPEEERNRLNEEYNAIKKEVTRRNSENTQRMVGYLEEFNKGRVTPAGRNLVILPMGIIGRVRLESEEVHSIGTDDESRLAVNPQTKQQKLTEYQTRMKDFTEFLKGKFFEENDAQSSPLEKLAA